MYRNLERWRGRASAEAAVGQCRTLHHSHPGVGWGDQAAEPSLGLPTKKFSPVPRLRELKPDASLFFRYEQKAGCRSSLSANQVCCSWMEREPLRLCVPRATQGLCEAPDPSQPDCILTLWAWHPGQAARLPAEAFVNMQLLPGPDWCWGQSTGSPNKGPDEKHRPSPLNLSSEIYRRKRGHSQFCSPGPSCLQTEPEAIPGNQ